MDNESFLHMPISPPHPLWVGYQATSVVGCPNSGWGTVIDHLIRGVECARRAVVGQVARQIIGVGDGRVGVGGVDDGQLLEAEDVAFGAMMAV